MLTQDQARAVVLTAQDLLGPLAKPANKRSVLAQIRRLGALQIDTISVVARSPYLVLWSRLGDYQPVWLDQLLAEGKLFEYWAHAACFLPIEDYPLYRHQMIDPSSFYWQYSHAWVAQNRLEIARVLDSIRARGSMRSIEFDSDVQRIPGWWEWKPAKRALEMLFTAGELMVARRENFHRVYDLRERVLPEWDDANVPDRAESILRLTEKAVMALGITAAEWTADYFRLPRQDSIAAAKELTERKVLMPVTVAGWELPGLIHRENLPLLRRAARGQLIPTVTTFLSPFDPIVWDRARARGVFAFDYRIECYTPEAKRQYGYFTLPILHRGALVGRMDAKAHRRDGIFEVKALHLEPEFIPSEQFAAELAAVLRRFADWHGTPKIVLNKTDPARFRTRLRAALKLMAKASSPK
jgi:uncharacterized protein YcaQ